MTESGNQGPRESITKTTYIGHLARAKENTSAQAKDLRNSHFTLGFENTHQSLPEYKSAYTQHNIAASMINPLHSQDLRASHIKDVFNPCRLDCDRSIPKSIYQECICQPTRQSVTPTKAVKQDLHATSFVLGSEASSFTTEMKDKYKKYKEYKAIRKAIDSSLESSDGLIVIGPKPTYITEAKGQFTGAMPDMKELGVSKKFSKDLRREHFSLGARAERVASYYQLYYNPEVKRGRPAKLNVKQLMDVKKSHFLLGDNSKSEISHYTDQHRWLQPVPSKECN